MFLTLLCPPIPQEELTTFDRFAHHIPPLDMRQPQWKTIHNALKASESTLAEIKARVGRNEFERKRWGPTMERQDDAVNYLISIGAHIPEEIEWDAYPIKSEDNKVSFIRKRWVIQGICGSDNTLGHNASKKRDMPWRDVGCQFYIDITTTHMPDNDQELLTVDEVVGHPIHSVECIAIETMDNNARIARVPLAKLKEKACAWASKNLGNGAGSSTHHSILNSGDMSSMYQTQSIQDRNGSNAAGEQFDVTVATTDNDTREHKALLSNWPDILLLLCIFHTWQSWRNALNRYLRPITNDDDRKATRKRLSKFAIRLLKETSSYTEAVSSYNTEISHFTTVGRQRITSAKKVMKAVLSFLGYFHSYLKDKNLWTLWSPAGALLASQKLGIPVSQVARTTNALESWNGRAKGQYMAHHQHSGRLLWPDHWIHTMILVAVPAMLADWLQKRQREAFYASMHTMAPIPAVPSLHSRHPTAPQAPPQFPVPPTPDLAPPCTAEEAMLRANDWIAQAVSLSPLPPPVEDTPTLEELESDPLEEEEAKLEDMVNVQNVSMVHESFFPSDIALNHEDIIADLNSIDVDVPETEESDLESFTVDGMIKIRQNTPRKTHSQSLPTSPTPAPRSSVERATAVMDLNVAEDALVVALKRMLDLGTPKEELARHISEHVAAQLFGHAPEVLMLPPLTPQPSPPRCPTTSPMIELLATHQRNFKEGDQLVPIVTQTKQTQKVSYSCR
ncbi:hypothetical protein C8F01DRAFT_1254295 [Mycena amicta]|nr:hypothetical protein C8F01DRAFT_1254295 [Mycena amicta]